MIHISRFTKSGNKNTAPFRSHQNAYGRNFVEEGESSRLQHFLFFYNLFFPMRNERKKKKKK